jgi:peptidyl-prolyl cis-trans isomerase D
MATLQSIRNKAGILVSVVIGLALLSFILSDLITKNSLFSSDRKTDVAEIYGETVSMKVFEEKINELTENYKRNTQKETVPDDETSQGIRDQAWETIVTDYVVANNLEDEGVTVHPDELKDIIVGSNIDPQVQQIPIFKDQQSGQFDPNLVRQFITNLDKDPTGKQRLIWVSFEKQLEHQHLLNKYYNLIKKGIYVTSSEAKQYAEDGSNNIDIRYIMKKYGDVSDSTIAVTEAEMGKYYNEKSYLFEQEASRDLEYVVFDVTPSKEDIQKIETKMNEIKEDYINTTDVADFINKNSDVPYTEEYFAKGKLSPVIDSLMFAQKPGFVYGPYIENDEYKLAKLMSFKNLPDSVHARHILIAPSEKRSLDQAKSLADSIKNLIKKGGDFAQLASLYSDDKGSATQGGDVKWFKMGMMVKPFEKAAFEAKKGDVVTAETQFGIHIIEVLEKSEESNKAEIAFINWKIEPSSQSYQTIQSKAYQFAGVNTTKDKFNSAVTKDGLTKRLASNLRENDRNIAGLESPREMIRWAYKEETKKGDVSQPFEFLDKFVIAVLTEVREKGIAPQEQIKEQLTSLVRKDKKAETFIKELKNASVAGSIDGVAQKLNIMAQDASGINFNSFSLPGVGIEPNVVATAVYTPKGKISKPIKGNNGVFMIAVTNITKAPPIDPITSRLQLANEIQSRVDYQAFDALKKLADIKDYRSQWY